MKFENYIFTGYGYATGKHQITNKELEEAVKKGYLDGFNEARIMASENYQAYKAQNPEATPFEYMAWAKMGFNTRNHVTPFPVTDDKIKKSENGTHLAVQAIEKALDDAGINPEEIDFWLGSTGTPHEQAPGIASTVKCFFTNSNNQAPTATLTSACVGFNINLQRAIEYLKTHPKAKHIVVFHAETLSHLLTRRTNFVNFVTFADGAAAVVLSRSESDKKEGIVSIVNYEDLWMVDHLGSDSEWNLYMTPQVVRIRATKNIVKTAKEVCDKSGWKTDDVDILVPHQTGNAIVHPSAEALNIPLEKVYQEVQHRFGNISGASVPSAYALLKEAGRLLPGSKLVSPVAGLGGEYGAFSYIVPEKTNGKGINVSNDLKGKTTLLTGSTGGFGLEIAKSLAKRGSNLILQYNSNDQKAEALKKELSAFNIKTELVKADFSKHEEVEKLIEFVKANYKSIDYLMHTAAVTGGLSRASEVNMDTMQKVLQVNQFSAVALTKGLKDIVKDTILYTGSVAEDGQFSGSSSYVQAKKGLHGFAGSFAGEAKSMGLRSVYYMPGTVDGGMAGQLSEEQINAALFASNQSKRVSTEEIAERMVNSLYKLKVVQVTDTYEGALLVRRDTYKWE